MSQQMVNGSRYEGSVTYTNRMSYEYAVVGEPGKGKWKKERKAQQQRRQRNIRKGMEALTKPSRGVRK